MDGAVAPGPCWASPPRLVTRKMASSVMSARPAKAATFTPAGSPSGRPPEGRRDGPAAGRRSRLPVLCGCALPDGLGVLVLIAVLPEIDPVGSAGAGAPPAELPEGPPGQQARRRGQ